MISRRRFLEAGGLAAGVTAVARPLLTFGTTSDGKSGDFTLPPSLARLNSRKNDATPITREERHERQERARKLMSENGLDGIVLMEGTSLRYFTGILWWGGERMFALVLPAKGAAFYVCPAFEEGRAHEQIAGVHVISCRGLSRIQSTTGQPDRPGFAAQESANGVDFALRHGPSLPQRSLCQRRFDWTGR